MRVLSLSSAWASRLGMGLIGMGLLVAAEFTIVLRIRKMSLREYLQTRDPVSGAIYYALIGLFMFLPLLVETS